MWGASGRKTWCGPGRTSNTSNNIGRHADKGREKGQSASNGKKGKARESYKNTENFRRWAPSCIEPPLWLP